MKGDDKSGDVNKPVKSGKVDPTVQGQIGARLRDMYDHVLSEPVPDRFLTLLKQLEDRDGDKDE